MSIYAISDLHLSGANPKPMCVFGENWYNHWDKIKYDWLLKVCKEDTILIPGDISWALSLEDAIYDIKEISNMPGTKVFIKGNHDYWWGSLKKVRDMMPSNIKVIQNDFISAGQFNICGTRGWMLPLDIRSTALDEKIYNREIIRFELSLAKAALADDKPIIAMLHYPPFNDKGEISEFIKIMKKYNVKECIYGHLHGEALKNVIEGNYNDIHFSLVSCDYLDFKLKKIN